jgi:hypothetical protein
MAQHVRVNSKRKFFGFLGRHRAGCRNWAVPSHPSVVQRREGTQSDRGRIAPAQERSSCDLLIIRPSMRPRFRRLRVDRQHGHCASGFSKGNDLPYGTLLRIVGSLRRCNDHLPRLRTDRSHSHNTSSERKSLDEYDYLFHEACRRALLRPSSPRPLSEPVWNLCDSHHI